MALLGALEAVLRLVFYYEAVFAGAAPLQSMPPAATMIVVNSINLALGLAGLLGSSALLLASGWGYWGTVIVSLATIVFDGVSAAAVSTTALAGLILPAVFLLVLVPRRGRQFDTGSRKNTFLD